LHTWPAFQIVDPDRFQQTCCRVFLASQGGISDKKSALFTHKDMKSMTGRLASITLATLALLNLAACTHYRYVKPETEQGQRCVAQLDARVHRCKSSGL